jgi:nucleoside-diphosphate-sugar epimerase
MKLLVTGANGFIGKSLSEFLDAKRYHVCRVVRSVTMQKHDYVVGDINGNTDWISVLIGVDIVIHTAARTHIMNEIQCDSLSEFRAVNVHGTLNLARQAAAAGVKRFVFLSSIKVNGEITFPNQSFLFSQANPQDAYGVSKYEAEQGLREIAQQTGMEVVIIRPPLIYGANAPGNFGALLRVIKRGLPLPFGAVTNNRRSFVALDNLIDLVTTCIHHPNAANQTFLVSDNKDVSIADLLRRLAEAQGVPSRLFAMPVGLLNFGAKVLGKQAVAQRLLGSLQVDISHTMNTLNWQPPISLDEGLRRTTS